MGYYLVRQNNETIKGPMTLKELAAKVNSLEVTMADEVSGNLGPWAFLESDEFGTYYPEIVAEINVSKQWESEPPTLLSKKLRGKSSKSENPVWKVFAFAMLIGLVALTTLIYKNDKELRSKNFDSVSKLPSTNYVSHSDLFKKIEAAFDRNSKGEVVELLKSVKIQKEFEGKTDLYYKLLPILRYVYFSDGALEADKFAFSQEFVSDLIGPKDSSAPELCSVEKWKNSFNDANNEMAKIGIEKVVQKFPDLRALFWNPVWVSKRRESGWYYPFNYYHACLVSAKKALTNMGKSIFLKKSYERISIQLELVENPDSNFIPKVNGLLSVVSCFELNMGTCKANLNLSSKMKEFLQRTKTLNLIYSGLKTGNMFLSKEAVLPKREPFTGLDIRAESLFIDWYRRTGDPVKAKNRLTLEFPNISF